MGAKALARRLRPDVLIVLDGDFCSDTPAAGAKELGGEVRLGAGPVLSRGAGSNEPASVMACRGSVNSIEKSAFLSPFTSPSTIWPVAVQ